VNRSRRAQLFAVGGLSTFSFAFAQTRCAGRERSRTRSRPRFNEIDARLLADVDMRIERRRFANVCEAIWQHHD
jgi:hypothetical protein